MTNFSPSANRLGDVKYYAAAIYEDLYPVSMGDRVVCKEFLNTVDLSQALLVNNSDGAEITTTVALNVVTVSGAASYAECTLFVFGRRKN